MTGMTPRAVYLTGTERARLMQDGTNLLYHIVPQIAALHVWFSAVFTALLKLFA
jgi:hypothetical protein